MTGRRARLALSLAVEPGDPRLRDLLAVHEPAQVLEAIHGRRTLSAGPIPQAWAERTHDLDRRLAEATAKATAQGLRWTCPGDRHWPDALHDLDHVEPLHGATGAPIGLWLRGAGDLGALTARSVAIVGARDCTTYGAECASDLAADSADAGYTVVSGAAFGIDGCAHRGALAMSKPTIAVLACGADVDYPRPHAGLIARVAEVGLVVSEQAPGQTPLKSRFLSRNRLIAALSQGTVVVEAATRSGSLNTMNWADQLGRVTMAVPGPVTSRLSAGVHTALRAGKAVLVTSGKEVVEELGGLGSQCADRSMSEATSFDGLPPAAQRTLDGLAWNAARSVQDVAVGSRLSAREAGHALHLLERRGFAAKLGTGWVLARRADVV